VISADDPDIGRPDNLPKENADQRFDGELPPINQVPKEDRPRIPWKPIPIDNAEQIEDLAVDVPDDNGTVG
jgi:hypothetical protein